MLKVNSFEDITLTKLKDTWRKFQEVEWDSKEATLSYWTNKFEEDRKLL